jgi:GNAT superfamily N-acetyltransferase
MRSTADVEIAALPVSTESLTEYSTVSIAFEVRSRLTITLLNDGLGGMLLREEAVIPPYVKDYGETGEEGPMRWLERFNTSNWVLFLAREGDIPVGGAAVAWHTPGVHMLRDRKDIAVLWDIRVHPERRRSGIGTLLFSEAARWAGDRNCNYLKIETQNVNVPACRFYVRQGCLLGEIDRFAYNEQHLAHETMLVWYLGLQWATTTASGKR